MFVTAVQVFLHRAPTPQERFTTERWRKASSHRTSRVVLLTQRRPQECRWRCRHPDSAPRQSRSAPGWSWSPSSSDRSSPSRPHPSGGQRDDGVACPRCPRNRRCRPLTPQTRRWEQWQRHCSLPQQGQWSVPASLQLNHDHVCTWYLHSECNI